MTEFSQAKVNELLDQYRNGSISKEDRFKLEKLAIDDPFLFDALEGFSLEKDIEKRKDKTRILTLPRIAIAASLVLLIAVIVNLKSNLNTQSKPDQSIAMVLDGEEEAKSEVEIIIEKTPVKQEASTTLAENESELKNEVPQAKEPIKNKKVKATDQNEKANSQLGKSKSNLSAKEEIEPATAVADTGDKNKTSEDILSGEKLTVPVEDYDMAEEDVTEKASRDEVINKNASNFEDLQKATETTMIDSNLSSKSDMAKKARSQAFYIVEPIIGKTIFDDYAKELIDEKGLRQPKPQEVTIEFSINENGELTDFRHIFSGCAECGSFAIAILQNSGEWRTVPPGFSGRARYTFTF